MFNDDKKIRSTIFLVHPILIIFTKVASLFKSKVLVSRLSHLLPQKDCFPLKKQLVKFGPEYVIFSYSKFSLQAKSLS